MLVFDKNEIKESLSTEDIYNLLQEWGGEPEFTSFGIISSTICHNLPGEGSRKLYFYENSGLFKCYTECDSTFDIFELAIKVALIQASKTFDLNDAVRYIAYKMGLSGREESSKQTEIPEDWKFLANYDRINAIKINNKTAIELKPYDENILTHFNYDIKLTPWLKENISQKVLKECRIGFYPGGDQITIPHYDINGKFIGLRGRAMCKDECERYGKYRPLNINNILYTHPLGMNLYNLNLSKENIKNSKTAIVFESEKSCLKMRSYFGPESDISVACCGSSLSVHQMDLLLDLGVNEVIIAFDRQFQAIGDIEFKHLTTNLTKLYNKYKNLTSISFIFDKEMITNYKDSPIDCGKDIFLHLLDERISL